MDVILRSRHFYSRAAYRQRIKSPVEWSAGLVRMLEVARSALNPLALAAACDAQGQELFVPPNVEGWAGGSTWINSGTLLERTNWAADVVWGRAGNGLTPFDPAAWAARYKLPADRIAAGCWISCSRAMPARTRAGSRSTPAATAVPTDSARSLQRLANCSRVSARLRGDPMHPTRRAMLRLGLGSSTLLACGDGPAVPGTLRDALAGGRAAAKGRILVVVQLDGGNDGLNTVVPYGDDEYRKRRPKLAISASEVKTIDDQVGLHPGSSRSRSCWSTTAGDRAERGLPQPESVALREHGDLAHRQD